MPPTPKQLRQEANRPWEEAWGSAPGDRWYDPAVDRYRVITAVGDWGFQASDESLNGLVFAWSKARGGDRRIVAQWLPAPRVIPSA